MSTTLDYWEQRLANWALWYVGGSRLAISSCDGLWGEGAPEPPPPLVGEALDTDRLMCRLASDGKLGRERFTACQATYCWTGTLEMKAAKLNIHRDTLADRVRAAKYWLDDRHHASRRRDNPPTSMLACA